MNELIFTKIFAGFSSKNAIAINGDIAYIELPNTDPLTYATASASDIPFLACYRLRNIQGRIFTTLFESGSDWEKKTPIEPLLLTRSHKHELIDHKNNNELDIRRANLKRPRTSTKTNFVDIQGEVAYMTLNKGLTVILDTTTIDLLRSYHWRVIRKPRKTGFVESIRARYRDSVTRREICMERIILGLTPNDPPVVFKNGDRFDCRVANLECQTSFYYEEDE